MKRSLRQRFPSVAVGPVGLFRLRGMEWLGPGTNRPNQVPCPGAHHKANTSHAGSALDVVPDPEGGWYVGPCRCGWAGSLFDWFLEASGLTAKDALRALRAAGFKIPRGTGSDRVLVAWEHERQVRRSLAATCRAYQDRRLSGPVHGQALSALDLTAVPHNPQLWWCTTPSEVDLLFGRLVHPHTTYLRRLGASTPEEAAKSTIVIPLYDALDRLTGMVGYSVDHRGASALPYRTVGRDVSLGFLPVAGCRVPALGDFGILTSCPDQAVRILRGYTRDNPTPPPVVLLTDLSRPEAVARALPSRPWLYLRAAGYEPSPGLVRLARLLDMKYSSVDRTVSAYAPALAKAVDRAVTWQVQLDADVQRLQGGGYTYHDANLFSFLSAAGVTADNLPELKRHLSRNTYEAVERAFRAPVAVVRVAAGVGLTVLETAAGLIWEETGEVLAESYPFDVKPVRVGSRVGHAGMILHAGRAVPFKSFRFRRDPVGVMEAALLKAGAAVVPTVHPRLAPHLADVTLYLSKGRP